ncbi:MAG TPA: branched-chain amino acid ABC transporter permease [Aurantimonas coralicida]|uniref:Branched-chain amino acid ABC transporter permease n=2 Tax=root TaxID=1 RepID=A0A9C9NL19_9HYPH|nr:branched-chain amino acid ABC transporter permease [Aurantimonas coralicida]HEU03238.1 branched-chain amino acid ABC transporter permease [Aurantimonas coralicida]
MHGETAARDRSSLFWALQGIRGITSPPALILTTAFVGFAALCRDAGLTWVEASFMTATVWALPAKIVLVGAITAGASLPATALAVALSSLRMMPMVVALMPVIKGPKTRTGTLLFLSHFVAITGWIFAMERIETVPRDKRTVFFGAFAVTLTTINTVLVALVFNLMGQLPALATGALAFLTPVYFLTSLFGTAREASGRIALFTGMAALPPAHWFIPGFELLVAGIAGGTVAYMAGRIIEGRRLA